MIDVVGDEIILTPPKVEVVHHLFTLYSSYTKIDKKMRTW